MPKISIIFPVLDETENLIIMVNLLNTMIDIDIEILVVVDSEYDLSIPIVRELEKKFKNVYLIINFLGKGVRFAIQEGIQKSKSDVILISTVDEIFPIIKIKEMYNLIYIKGYDFVSGTRYSLGGKRIGGSLVGGVLSFLANYIFKRIKNVPLSDLTTGIKMMKKNVWNNISLESNIGWAFAFELSLKVIKKKFNITECPLISVDRVFGGKSSFKLFIWLKEYSRWFLWGLKNL